MKCTPQNTIVEASTVGRDAGEPERVADVVGDVLDLGQLVVVSQDDRVALLREPANLVGPTVGEASASSVTGSMYAAPARHARPPVGLPHRR